MRHAGADPQGRGGDTGRTDELRTSRNSGGRQLRAEVRVRKRAKFECAFPFPPPDSGFFGFGPFVRYLFCVAPGDTGLKTGWVSCVLC